jgi:hypothetical protein
MEINITAVQVFARLSPRTHVSVNAEFERTATLELDGGDKTLVIHAPRSQLVALAEKILRAAEDARQ